MRRILNLLRIWRIQFIFAKYGIDMVILSLPWFKPLRLLIYLNPFNWFRHKDFQHGVAIRQALVDLGPVFVKFGQALSTRPDILPPDIAKELSTLQDTVPPFSPKQARQMVEAEFGQSIGTIFLDFEEQPLASASIAQVHSARLHTGEQVVVKIMRPNIYKDIKRDLRLMHALAKLGQRYLREGSRLRPCEVVAEFEKSILAELDFMREAASASQLRRNFLDSPLLYVPKVYWQYTRSNILVQERIYGIPITDIDALKNHGVNIKLLSERGVEIFFTQVFRDSFFHADMHPGNLFVSYEHPQNPQYLAVDFGIIGTLTDKDQRYLAENLLAFFNRNYRLVAELHVASGWVPPDTPVNEFEGAIRTVCEPIFERPLKDISFAQVILRLFETGRQFKMVVQPQLMLLQKTLLSVEGLGRQLYPDLDLWTSAKPFLEKWVSERVGPIGFIKKLNSNMPFWLEKMPDLPLLVHEILTEHKTQQVQHNLPVVVNVPADRLKLKRSFVRGVSFGLLSFGLLLFFGSDYIRIVTSNDVAVLLLALSGIMLLFFG